MLNALLNMNVKHLYQVHTHITLLITTQTRPSFSNVYLEVLLKIFVVAETDTPFYPFGN